MRKKYINEKSTKTYKKPKNILMSIQQKHVKNQKKYLKIIQQIHRQKNIRNDTSKLPYKTKSNYHTNDHPTNALNRKYTKINKPTQQPALWKKSNHQTDDHPTNTDK